MYVFKDFNINTSQNKIFDDLYGRDFDLTWQKNLNPRPKVFSIIQPEEGVAIDDGSVLYEYNEQGFRSDDFKKNHDGKHVLFVGCSETEGVGGNIEDAWPKILYDKISKKEKCSGFFNLSKSGWGWSRIIPNSLLYFEKYGYPDLMFILLPNHQRHFYYDTNSKEFIYGQIFPEYYDVASQKQYSVSVPRNTEPKEYFEDFAKFLISWKLFMDFCKNSGIKVFFGAWDELDAYNISNCDLFYEYVTLDIGPFNEFIFNYYKNHEVRDNDLRKRDRHAGRITHHYWANKFYERYDGMK